MNADGMICRDRKSSWDFRRLALVVELAIGTSHTLFISGTVSEELEHNEENADECGEDELLGRI